MNEWMNELSGWFLLKIRWQPVSVRSCARLHLLSSPQRWVLSANKIWVWLPLLLLTHRSSLKLVCGNSAIYLTVAGIFSRISVGQNAVQNKTFVSIKILIWDYSKQFFLHYIVLSSILYCIVYICRLNIYIMSMHILNIRRPITSLLSY